MIYFDNNATMPFSLSAREAWNESQEFFWFNPAGLSNESTKVRVLIKEAKQELGSYFDRSADQVIFTSGSTESNNLVFQSLSKILGNKKKILLHADEHSSVLKPAQSCFRNQWDFFNFYDNKFCADTKILSDLGALVICAANGETGSISPLSKALDITDQEGIFSFCDATQFFGKLGDFQTLKRFDFISGSAHKFGGPKGLGFLIIPKGVSVSPQLLGGGQQLGMRSGTENYPAINSMMAAWKEIYRDLANSQILEAPRDLFEKKIVELVKGTKVLFSDQNRLWNTSFLVMPKYESKRWVLRMNKLGFIIGSGSACSTNKKVEIAEGSFREKLSSEEQERTLRLSSSLIHSKKEWMLLLDAFNKTWLSLKEDAKFQNSNVLEI